MIFSSITFLYLYLPLALLLYFAMPSIKLKNAILIPLSLFFYAWGEPIWVSLLIFSSFVDYIHGLIAEKYRGFWLSKAALVSSLVINLGLLGFFKYAGFLLENINALLDTSFTMTTYNLPIGISFYTFQTLSYVFDVYTGRVKAQRSPAKLLLYVSMFPQLIAGPIVRYRDIAAEIDKRIISSEKVSAGLSRFVLGLGKKVIIANTAGALCSQLMNSSLGELSIIGAWFGILMFALQIYFDFSGYSDMAIGLGKIFGFTYKENFNHPYIANSATEFWRRWHISLGSFFRDYVYIPLGGNKRYYVRNLFTVWFLTGLWHGASWNFILWGLYFGLLIFIERLFLSKFFEALPKIIGYLYFYVIVLVGWVFFYYTDLSIAVAYLKLMFGLSGQPMMDLTSQLLIEKNIYFTLLACILCTPIKALFINPFNNRGRKSNDQSNNKSTFQWITPIVNIALLLIVTSLLVGDTYNPFLYFRF